MAISHPIPTAYPTLATATWTKLNTIPGKNRRKFECWNFSTTVTYRFLCLPSRPESYTTDAAWAVAVNAAYGAASGKTLAPALVSGQAGGGYVEDYDCLTSGDVWAYQASGGNLAALSVDEGV